jgi:hypothetical protein
MFTVARISFGDDGAALTILAEPAPISDFYRVVPICYCATKGYGTVRNRSPKNPDDLRAWSVFRKVTASLPSLSLMNDRGRYHRFCRALGDLDRVVRDEHAISQA